LIYVGNHGLEISGPEFVYIEPAAVDTGPALRQLTTQLAQRLQSVPGAIVEDKGLTASVHFREVAPDDCETVRRQVHAALATASHPFVLTTGDKVYEMRPRTYWNKVAAMDWIKEKLYKQDALVIYLSDDVTDEEVFTTLADHITIKVGDPTNTAARYHLAGPDEVQRFLKWVVTRIYQDSPHAVR
jgi:trehalose-phosphatase